MYSSLTTTAFWDALPQEKKIPQHYFTMGGYQQCSMSLLDSTRYPCFPRSDKSDKEDDMNFALDLPNRFDFPDPNQIYDVAPMSKKEREQLYPRVQFSTGSSISQKETNNPDLTDDLAMSMGVESSDEQENDQYIQQKETFHHPLSSSSKRFQLYEHFRQQEKQKQPSPHEDAMSRLPVMDFRYNIREICKQLCLLEDHLIHWEKRCYDCCVKHFLMIEALAEETLTLSLSPKDIQATSIWKELPTLPSKIRSFQSQFYEIIHREKADQTSKKDSSSKNSTMEFMAMVQELRRLRKQYMTIVFSIPFRSKNQTVKFCSSTFKDINSKDDDQYEQEFSTSLCSGNHCSL